MWQNSSWNLPEKQLTPVEALKKKLKFKMISMSTMHRSIKIRLIYTQNGSLLSRRDYDIKNLLFIQIMLKTVKLI